MPEIAIIDAHLHLIAPERFTYGFSGKTPMLDRPWTLADFIAKAHPVEIAGAVFVEVWADDVFAREEAVFADEIAGEEPLLLGLVVNARLETGEGEQDLAHHKALSRVKGVRRLVETQDAIAFCADPGLRSGIRAAASMGWPFDICARAPQLDAVRGLVEALPDVRFILDHCGKPPLRDGNLARWREDIRALAGLPNLHCKLSGLTTEADHDHWREDELLPVMAHCIDRFGPERIVYGGDWPVSELATAYPHWVDLVDRVLAGLSAREKAAIYRDNAIHFYNLTMR
jgi:L-fuconolactonase